jgi:phosphate starvation-inducible protein PhoH and related proteins
MSTKRTALRINRPIPRKEKQSKNRQQNPILFDQQFPTESLIVSPKKPVDNSPIKGKTANHQRYINSIQTSPITFAYGPAGTGKTYISTAWACQQLVDKKIEQLIITRPAVEAGENLGFLPGELEEKYEPYIAPFRNVFNKRLGKSFAEYLIKTEQIKAIPLGFCRGLTFENSIVILDEAQNTTVEQMKMFLTRMGPNCTLIINGDTKQKDIKVLSGLADAIKRLENVDGIEIVKFEIEDIVRHDLVQKIVQAYETD